MKKILIFILMSFIITPKILLAEEIDLASTSKSYILLENSSGEIVSSKNEHERFAPASMTKIMTMLLVMEAIDSGALTWEETVTVSENASSMGGSQILLEVGEVMTVRDLFKGVAVGSGNDAAVALAERVSGTEEAFVNRMNQRAKELGLKNTNFKNPTGLDEANHYSSAYDMSIIARELIKHEKVLKFTSIYEDYLRANTDRKFWLVNTNKVVC
ncbi:MAG: D-alanyl-D-alanine carboxypeptidase family protein [Bacilli bacterium]